MKTHPPKERPETRTAAAAPQSTRHLSANEKEALDLHAEAEHTDGNAREKMIREIGNLASNKKSGSR